MNVDAVSENIPRNSETLFESDVKDFSPTSFSASKFSEESQNIIFKVQDNGEKLDLILYSKTAHKLE